MEREQNTISGSSLQNETHSYEWFAPEICKKYMKKTEEQKRKIE